MLKLLKRRNNESKAEVIKALKRDEQSLKNRLQLLDVQVQMLEIRREKRVR